MWVKNIDDDDRVSAQAIFTAVGRGISITALLCVVESLLGK